jgi:hypothetical protein
MKGEQVMTNTSTVSEYHRIISPLVGLALCMALMPSIRGAAHSTAAPSTTNIAEQFSGESLTVPDGERNGPVDIIISKWSSDADVALMRESLQNADADGMLAVLYDQHPTIGVVLMPGVGVRGARARTRTPRSLLFARDVKTATGRQVIAIVGEHLGLGESRLEARKSTLEFNLIDIRFGPDGKGVGKVVTAEDIAYSPKTGLVEVKDFNARPARLVDVHAEKPLVTAEKPLVTR